jgi:hypothetical protein
MLRPTSGPRPRTKGELILGLRLCLGPHDREALPRTNRAEGASHDSGGHRPGPWIQTASPRR